MPIIGTTASGMVTRHHRRTIAGWEVHPVAFAPALPRAFALRPRISRLRVRETPAAVFLQSIAADESRACARFLERFAAAL